MWGIPVPVAFSYERLHSCQKSLGRAWWSGSLKKRVATHLCHLVTVLCMISVCSWGKNISLSIIWASNTFRTITKLRSFWFSGRGFHKRPDRARDLKKFRCDVKKVVLATLRITCARIYRRMQRAAEGSGFLDGQAGAIRAWQAIRRCPRISIGRGLMTLPYIRENNQVFANAWLFETAKPTLRLQGINDSI